MILIYILGHPVTAEREVIITGMVQCDRGKKMVHSFYLSILAKKLSSVCDRKDGKKSSLNFEKMKQELFQTGFITAQCLVCRIGTKQLWIE